MTSIEAPPGARYRSMFEMLSGRDEGAFIPFAMLGDPSPADTPSVLRALVEGGADALELGIPFSDPVADGPTVQAAATRALTAGMHVADCWPFIAEVRSSFPTFPIGLLVYANLIVRQGTEAFYRNAALAGVDSVLIADVPLLEIAPFQEVARTHGVATVMIAPPNADQQRLAAIAATSEGYTYVVTRAGVTGADEQLDQGSAGQIAILRDAGAPPTVHGFGIAHPNHVRLSRQLGAAGAISGSAVVTRIAELHTDPARALSSLVAFVKTMKQATRSEG